jgi:AraC-like DNA-binding protein
MENLISPITLYPVNLIHLIYLSIAVFGLILVSQKSQISSLRNVLLLVVLLLICNLIEETGFSPNAYLITPIFTLGFGPALYWFCRQLVYSEVPHGKKILIHWLPMLLALPFTYWPQTIIALGSLSQAIYLSLAIHLVKRYHKITVQACSDTHDISIHWMTKLLILFLLMMFQDLIRLNLQPFVPLETLRLWYFFNTCIYTGLISYLVIMAIRQPHTFTHFSQFEFLAETMPTPAIDADPSAHSLFQEVDNIIRTKELYQQPRFSLRDLATATGIQEKTLSWIINQGAQKNFSEYINQLRVDAACAQLYQGKSSSLLDLAYTVGFSSKSTFNAVFKKQTGLTPSQFANKYAPETNNTSAES